MWLRSCSCLNVILGIHTLPSFEVVVLTFVCECGKNMDTMNNVLYLCVNNRAVKVSALINAINVAAINALKYFNAINATLFTSGVRCPLTRNRRVPT